MFIFFLPIYREREEMRERGWQTMSIQVRKEGTFFKARGIGEHV
jgi:hypothetical protein